MTDTTKEAELDKQEAAGERPRSLPVFLAELEYGELAAEATQAQADLVRRIKDIMIEMPGAKPAGSLTIKLDFRAEGDQIDVRADLSVKMPKSPRRKQAYWATESGGLTRSDPRQRDLPFRDVKDARPVRDAV